MSGDSFSFNVSGGDNVNVGKVEDGGVINKTTNNAKAADPWAEPRDMATADPEALAAVQDVQDLIEGFDPQGEDFAPDDRSRLEKALAVLKDNTPAIARVVGRVAIAAVDELPFGGIVKEAISAITSEL